MSVATSLHCPTLAATNRYRAALEALEPTHPGMAGLMNELGEASDRLRELAGDPDVMVSRQAGTMALELAVNELPDFERALVLLALRHLQGTGSV